MSILNHHAVYIVGIACDSLACPPTTAWFGDVGPNHVNTAVCSGAGDCNPVTGTCTNCGGNWGAYTGIDCEMTSCVTNINGTECNDNGLCLSLSAMATLHLDSYGSSSPIAYYSPWDA